MEQDEGWDKLREKLGEGRMREDYQKLCEGWEKSLVKRENTPYLLPENWLFIIPLAMMSTRSLSVLL